MCEASLPQHVTALPPQDTARTDHGREGSDKEGVAGGDTSDITMITAAAGMPPGDDVHSANAVDLELDFDALDGEAHD